VTPAAAPAAPTETVLTEEFRAALALAESGASPLFITGRAGTGKSTLLRLLRDKLGKDAAVLAPTGLAAVQVGGATLHSFFLFPPKLLEARDVKPLKHKTKLFQRIKTIILDEVSMVRADLMNAVDLSLRLHRKDDRPFGGVQMIFFGDLYQLPPVVREPGLADYFDRVYGTPYFFSAPAFKEAPLRGLNLTRVFRQRDESFLSLLEKVRTGDVGEEDIARLNERSRTPPLPGAVVLTARNATADHINNERLDKIRGAPKAFEALVEGTFSDAAQPADRLLRLKKGAKVMFVKNNGVFWNNGTLGEVEDFEDDAVLVRVGESLHVVTRTAWKVIGYRPAADGQGLEEETLGSFEQFPLRLAWAVTIHKSQGLTLEAAEIDLGAGAFAHGQLYVALSRCRELKNVRIRGAVRPQDVIFDQRVRDFHEGPAMTAGLPPVPR
jgi:ATP-dependent exoDNAse (exonuclease V) alpha subunit